MARADGGHLTMDGELSLISRLDFGVGDGATVPGGGLALSEKAQIVLEIQAALQTG